MGREKERRGEEGVEKSIPFLRGGDRGCVRDAA